MSRRNAAYESGRKERVRLDRPTISVGNITTGGTGKTPMVRWLCERLIDRGVRPAVLMRGYRGTEHAGSDEQVMLEQFLGAGGAVIKANPDRVAGAAAALAEASDVGAFVLDDGFQHRRVLRDFDLVLISAIEPFGYGHVLPRGLLREPLSGLQRASAIAITHASRVSSDALAAIERTIRQHFAGPIYHADHGPVGFRTSRAAADQPVDRTTDDVRDQAVLAFCGLGEPRVFHEQLNAMGARVLGLHRFKDHHDYSADDLEMLYEKASTLGANILVATEKDWVKLRRLPLRTSGPEIWRLDVAIRFWLDDEVRLIDQIMTAIQSTGTGAPARPVV